MEEYFKVGDIMFSLYQKEIFYQFSCELNSGWGMKISDERIKGENFLGKAYSSLEILTLFDLDSINRIEDISNSRILMDRDEVAHNNTNVNCNHVIVQLSDNEKFYDKEGNYIKDTAFYFENLYTIQSLKFEFGDYGREKNTIPCRIVGKKNICEFEAKGDFIFTGYRFYGYDSVYEIQEIIHNQLNLINYDVEDVSDSNMKRYKVMSK